MAEPEHTALLLKCYTKLKDFTTLEEFLKTTPPSQYDHATAIEVLESAAYHGLAAEVAQKVGSHDDFVRISLEQFKNYDTTVQFLHSLPRVEAGRILLNYGRTLMRHAPKETVKLIRHVCNLRGQPMDGQAFQAECQGPTVDELLPVFADDLQQLEVFLRSVLVDDGCQLPQAQAERLFPTLLELLVKSHSSLLADGNIPAEKQEIASCIAADIMRLIRQYPSDAALANTLMVCQAFGFVDGFFHAAERLHRHQLLMQWCFEHKDAKRLLEVCKRYGSADQSLWVQALSFLASPESGGGHLEEMGEVLRHIEDSDLMPLLLVIETLRSSNEVTIGDVRPYLQAQYRRLVESAETSRAKSTQDRQEIARMQQEIIQLRTQAKEFQNTRCFQCGLTLEVPAVHFFCGHSYHAYCVPPDGTCPKCSSGALPKLSLKEQREAQARNAEDFFKYLQGGAGDRGIQAMGEWYTWVNSRFPLMSTASLHVAELDSPFADSRHQDAHVNIVIPKGSTRKQALSIIHLQTAAFYKKVDLEVTKEYVSTLQASTTFDHFMEVASQPEDVQVQALNQLGLTLPPGLSSNPNVSKEKALELYLAMVNKAAAKKVEQDKLAAKTAKEKEQLRDAIRAKDPKNLFESAVKQAMMDMSKQMVDPRVDYAQALASNENPINHIDWTKEAPPKRRFTKSELAQRTQAKAKGMHNTKEHAHKAKAKDRMP
ncbi:Vps11 [Symbiodinium sp. CCMP2592]|nr:Vps11 [Symbiodinium sp. CCMP2592]